MNKISIIALENIKDLALKTNEYLKKTNNQENYLVPLEEIRFSNGEGKIKLLSTIRGKEVYIMTDVGNHSISYKMYGIENHKSPDDHFADTKRIISAIRGHAESITVIMPLLYSSRQHRRKGRESLDCAIALKELENLGVKSIITFDVHDENIQNVVPLMAFENFFPTVNIINQILKNEQIDYNNTIVISPDTGAFNRARYYADMLKVDVGIFHKRRDLTQVVNGKNPVIAHEYLGKDVKGKDCIVVDDMIASGESMLDVAKELKRRGANNIYLASTFGLFCNGKEIFDEEYNKSFNRVYTTNLTYVDDKIKNSKWYKSVDCSIFIAKIINELSNNSSITPLLQGDPEVFEEVQKTLIKKL